jgi:hypothetical protein
VFPVKYELNFYISFRRISVFKGLMYRKVSGSLTDSGATTSEICNVGILVNGKKLEISKVMWPVAQ